jgi:uncharacterized protein YjiS (DUF1127 family)
VRTLLLPHPPRRGPATWWHDLARAWRKARPRARREPLDEATLRDLGIGRGELESIGYEAAHPAEVTRLRIAQMLAAAR